MKNSSDNSKAVPIRQLVATMLAVSLALSCLTVSASAIRPAEFSQKSEELSSEEKISLLESQIISAYGKCDDGMLSPEIKEYLQQLRELSPEQADKWDELMEYWQYINTEMPVNTDTCPQKLTDDSSLCIVVMGYQLSGYGTASKELKNRLKTALELSKEYPEAYIAVTGGHTASKNNRASEGKVMRDWLVSHGVSSSRIIVESDAMSTSENAILTSILLDEYPEITDLVIVTTDYHIRISCLVFQAQMILTGREARVVSNYANTSGHSKNLNISSQISSVKRILNSLKSSK